MAISFDIGLLPQGPIAETAELAVLAEELGFGGVWVADSQSVFRDAYAALALCAAKTRRIRLATGVTNPVTRHPAVIAGSFATLDELSGGRAILGLGVGESAVRTLGLKAARLRDLEEATEVIRTLLRGRPVAYQGREIRIAWAQRPVPVFLAASGPKSLQLAGRIADGVLIQAGADPRLIRWALKNVQTGAEQAGRNLEDLRIFLRLACAVSADGERAREEVKSYAAVAAGTLFTSVPREEMPAGLWSEIKTMKERYDYYQHADAAARHKEWVTDTILDAVAVAGTPEDVVPRLRTLLSLGIENFVVPLTARDAPGALRLFAEQVLPRVG
jgi:5,10-methylenetetrahydromethanopterin reductase